MAGRPHWLPAYIGVGSNLDDPAAQVGRALAALAELPDARGFVASALYRNPPLGPQDQPDYVNAVAALLTRLQPHQLLAQLQATEARLGRVRSPGDRWGPRVIDLDLLVCGSRRIDEDGLMLPHPGISERNFVLFPLHEIAPTLVVPGNGTVARMLQQTDSTGLVRLGAAQEVAQLPDNN